jgi:hypothetical protein
MRHKTFLLVALGAVAIAAAAVVSQLPPKDESELLPRKGATEEGHLVSGLQSLLKESASKDRSLLWHLFASVWELIPTKHRLNPLDAIIPGVRPDEVSIATFRDGRDTYFVVILRAWDHCIPGDDTQYLLLLDRKGRCLDRLSCSINARLTRMFVHHKGIFRTEVPKTPEKDGARLVIRYIPEDGGNLYGNWSHEIAHGGRASSYAWPKDKLEGIGPGEWDRKGLCRVAIRDGKFVRLFP